jgi:hypothetical protein
VKREIPLFLTAVIGIFMILSFFVPHQLVSVPADFLQQSAVILVAFGYVLGGANALKVNFDAVYRREPGWIYKLVLIASLLGTLIIGLAEGRNWQDETARSMWIYNNLYAPMNATMFSLLAFFIASAAFRAFRIRTLEAGLLAAAALIVMLGRVPVGDYATRWLPWKWIQLSSLQQWIMDNPQNAAKRAVLMGAAMGVMATGLRVILGIERSYLSGED